jgi:hypothetical protein
MTIKNSNICRLYGYPALASIILSLFVTSLYAEVSVNNIEKNDKITGSALSGQNLLADNKVKTWQLYAEQWELTRNGESVLSLPVLNKLINTWLEDRQKMIEIQYPGGEEGEFWVQELTDWLVSLGVPSNHIMMVPGSGADDMIKFQLRRH